MPSCGRLRGTSWKRWLACYCATAGRKSRVVSSGTAPMTRRPSLHLERRQGYRWRACTGGRIAEHGLYGLGGRQREGVARPAAGVDVGRAGQRVVPLCLRFLAEGVGAAGREVAHAPLAAAVVEAAGDEPGVTRAVDVGQVRPPAAQPWLARTLLPVAVGIGKGGDQQRARTQRREGGGDLVTRPHRDGHAVVLEAVAALGGRIAGDPARPPAERQGKGEVVRAGERLVVGDGIAYAVGIVRGGVVQQGIAEGAPQAQVARGIGIGVEPDRHGGVGLIARRRFDDRRFDHRVAAGARGGVAGVVDSGEGDRLGDGCAGIDHAGEGAGSGVEAGNSGIGRDGANCLRPAAAVEWPAERGRRQTPVACGRS